jgi:hypothetical protein
MSGHISSVDTTTILELATAKSALEQPAATGQVGQLLEARQLADVRAKLRDGETFSVEA